jgi:hypothetical protein
MVNWQFEIGKQVVCIKKDGDWTWEPPEIAAGCRGPLHGDVLTIRSIKNHELGAIGIALQFYEIVNPPVKYLNGDHECLFDAVYFRPVRRTDISELRKLTVPRPSVRVAEDA